MRYFYEYKYKNGCKVGGHNLEKFKKEIDNLYERVSNK